TARTHDFLRKFEPASLQAHSAKGILAAHPVLHLLFGGHLLVSPEFLIQLLIDLFLSEQRSETACNISEQRHSKPLKMLLKFWRSPLPAFPTLAFRYRVSFVPFVSERSIWLACCSPLASIHSRLTRPSPIVEWREITSPRSTVRRPSSSARFGGYCGI